MEQKRQRMLGRGVGTAEMGRLGRETAEVGKLQGWRSCRNGESIGVGKLEGWRSCRGGESTGVGKLQRWRIHWGSWRCGEAAGVEKLGGEVAGMRKLERFKS